MKLFEHPEFDQAMLRAASHFDLSEQFVDKDYYVTDILRIIAAERRSVRTRSTGRSVSEHPALVWLSDEGRTIGGLGREDHFAYETHFPALPGVRAAVRLEPGVQSGTFPTVSRRAFTPSPQKLKRPRIC
jgi:hypothetical protein